MTISTDLVGLIDSIDLPIVVVGRDATVARFNPAAATLLHLAPAHLGRSLRDVPVLAGAADIEDLCTLVIRGGVASQRQVRDRGGAWFLVRVASYTAPDGQVAGALLTLTNVTALHASVEQAIHEREYAKTIINTVSQPLVVLDAHLRVQTANRAFYATFGVSREDTEGVVVDALVGRPGDVPALRELLADIVSTNRPLEGLEVERDVPAVGRRTMLLHVCRLPGVGDVTPRILVTIEDVTERKRAEETLRASEQRARALAAEAQAANHVKDEFLATLSHELRTPLTAMLGWTRLLRSGVLAGEAIDRALETIERNVGLQTQLIEDLLDVSRIITGRLRLEPRRMELRVAVEAALETVRPAAQAKAIRLDVSLDPDGCPVWADSARLQQVIWNVLANAMRFTPAGGGVGVRLRRDASHATITVTDTGQGISAEFLPHVFEQFSQAQSNPARRHGGLGLGLSIARHLVELQGGTIRAESDGEGQGATLVVTLPLTLEGPFAATPPRPRPG